MIDEVDQEKESVPISESSIVELLTLSLSDSVGVVVVVEFIVVGRFVEKETRLLGRSRG